MSKVGPDQLGDESYPAMGMGQAAELLGAQPAFLRSLDAAKVLNRADRSVAIAVTHAVSSGWPPGSGNFRSGPDLGRGTSQRDPARTAQSGASADRRARTAPRRARMGAPTSALLAAHSPRPGRAGGWNPKLNPALEDTSSLSGDILLHILSVWFQVTARCHRVRDVGGDASKRRHCSAL